MDSDAVPRVSVRLPAHNHGKYVAACLQSVLAQTFQDFEIVITDDGSQDNTVEVIRSFQDERIRLNAFPENRGLGAAVADCGARLRGKYTACLCSDDAWAPDKLANQVRFLDEHPEYDAVFTRVCLIDDDGHPLPDSTGSPYAVFAEPNRSRDEWLRHFFLKGNCLCIPSVLIRTDVYAGLLFQDKRLASLSDFDLWIRFALNHDFYILDDRSTFFRIRAGEANASSSRLDNQIRSHFEYKQLMRHFLAIRDPQRLLRIFPECAGYGQPTAETAPYFLARRAIDTSEAFRQLWGLETLFDCLTDEGFAAQIEEWHGFRCKELHRLASQHDVFGLALTGMLQQARATVQSQAEELEQLRRNSHSDRQASERAQQEIDRLRQELTCMKNTFSWRVTRFLRVIRSLTRRRSSRTP